MAEYQIAANGPDDQLGHSFLPEFKRFKRFGLSLPFDITPQEEIKNGIWTEYSIPVIYDRILSVIISAPSKIEGAWTAEKMIEEVVITGADKTVIQRISNNYIRFWYQMLPQDRKSLWDKMTSSTVAGEQVYLDLPFSAFQDSSASLVPWGNIHLHVKWSPTVDIIVDTGKIVINTRNVIIDHDDTDDEGHKLETMDVIVKNNDEKQLVVQSHEQVETNYITSSSTALDLRGPCKDIWFGLKANADFSAHTSPSLVYSPNLGTYTQPHQSNGVVRISSASLDQTIDSADITVNDEKLFAVQRAMYFNQVVPYQRYTGCPAPGFYYHSFSLHPQRYQPSGSFNFSRVTNKYLNITNSPYESTLHVMSNRYNVTDKNIPIFLD